MDVLFTLDPGVVTKGQGHIRRCQGRKIDGVPTRGHAVVTYQAQALLATQDASLSACVFVVNLNEVERDTKIPSRDESPNHCKSDSTGKDHAAEG